MLVDGKWAGEWQPVQKKDKAGRFIRQTSSFRRKDIEAVKGRYHIYAALICPWAHRTLITRSLKGLEDVIGVTIVDPRLGAQGWQFGNEADGLDETGPDPFLEAEYLHEIYSQSDATYTGRATVPVLWDKKEKQIVNNESADIIQILNDGFSPLSRDEIDLYPLALRSEIDQLDDRIYERLNNGVYRAGFATSQQAYEEAFTGVFGELDALEKRLSDGRSYLVGDQLTQTDIRTYVSLVRFDAAYYGLFKTNLRRIAEYEFLQAYLERLYEMPAFKKTTNINHIKLGYYSIVRLNPEGLVPLGPDLPWYDEVVD